MSDEQVSFGEFFDQVLQWGEVNFKEGVIFLEKWQEIPSDVSLEEARAMVLDDGLVRAFADDMQAYLRERTQRIYSESLYARIQEGGHAFLKAIQAIAKALGVSIEELDAPFTPTEFLVAAGKARVVEGERLEQDFQCRRVQVTSVELQRWYAKEARRYECEGNYEEAKRLYEKAIASRR